MYSIENNANTAFKQKKIQNTQRIVLIIQSMCYTYMDQKFCVHKINSNRFLLYI